MSGLGPVSPLTPSGTPVPVTVTVHPTTTTEDEAVRNAVAWECVVHVGGVPVMSTRYLAHIHSPVHAVERMAREYGAAAFGHALSGLLGFTDPEGT